MDDETFFDALYASVVSDTSFEVVLRLLADRFGARAAALAYVDVSRPEADLSLGCGTLTAEVQATYRARYAQDDPAPAAMMALPVGRAAATDQLFSAAYMATSRFVQEFYYPAGFCETLGGPVMRDNGRLGIISVLRGGERPPFGGADIAAFERLMPHVARAFALRRAFFEADVKASALEAALDNINLASLTFDGAGLLLHANSAARTLLARDDGLLLSRAGRLSAYDAGAARKLRDLFDGNAALRAPMIFTAPVRGRTLPYILRAVTGRPPEGLIITVCDPATQVNDATALLSTVLVLSPAAAKLLTALAAGDDLRSYAERTGISLHTARFHLKALFAATGTARQSELVRLAKAILRDLGSAQALRTDPSPGLSST